MAASSESVSKVLVIRDDRIGDLLLATPVAEALKKKFPRVQITYLVSQYAQEIIERNPFIDQVIAHNPRDTGVFKKRFRELLIRLKSEHFDTVVVLRPTWQAAWLSWCADIPMRIGTGYRPFSFFFNRRIREHRKPSFKHEVEYNFGLLSPFNIQYGNELPGINLSETEKQQARLLLQGSGINLECELLAIHPGGGSGSARLWPVDYFAELADQLIKNGKQVIVSGALWEKNLIDSMRAKMKQKVSCLVGLTSLRILAAVFTYCKTVITNSTGPMHISAAVGTPVVALFGPIKTASPRRWGPLGSGHTVLQPSVPICNCRVERCRLGDCMRNISVAEVLHKVLSGQSIINRR